MQAYTSTLGLHIYLLADLSVRIMPLNPILSFSSSRPSASLSGLVTINFLIHVFPNSQVSFFYISSLRGKAGGGARAVQKF